METYLDLTNGLHTDFEPLNQPQKTYKYMLNGIRQLSGAIENEKGTVLSHTFDTNKKIVGSYVLDKDRIICLAGPSASDSEIGVLDNNGAYTLISNNPGLNFQISTIVKIEGKKNFKGQRIIYLVEKNGVNPMRAINIDDTLLLASPTFIDDIKLQINPSIPVIEAVSVVDGGSLPTGMYQAACRLLTTSTNATPFGVVSPLIPIIDDSSSLPIDQQDGANPQSVSPKAINFLISNVDTSYSFIEVAIITYLGTANISTTHIVARLPIDGRSTINFTYSSVSQNKESIDLESITVKPILYDKAETIAQKDSILTLGNLTATIDTFDFQQVANLVKLRYFIEEIAVSPGYKDPIIAATKKGYQRDEVYSIAITPEFVGQYNTTAYHIPGNSNSVNANTTTKELGGYRSLEQYPLNKGYPAGALRILGIEADFSNALLALPTATKNRIKGFSLVRQIRTEDSKSVLAQGIANTHYKIPESNAKFLAPVPKIIYGGSPFISGSNSFSNELGFYSPETTIYNNNIIGNLVLKTVAQLDGTQRVVNHSKFHNNGDGVIANFALFMDYDSQSSVTANDVNIVSNAVQYIKEDSADTASPDSRNIIIAGTNTTVNNFKSNGYLYLKTSAQLPIRQQSYSVDGMAVPEFYYKYSASGDTIFLRGNAVSFPVNNASDRSQADRYLYNIVRVLDRQYGAIYDATYVYCDSYKLSTDLTKRFFGGDTFIGKFGVLSDGSEAGGPDEIMYKVLSYYYCESTINVGYRHYSNPVGVENQSGFIPGTTPYYPKLSTLYSPTNDQSQTPGILNLSWALGHGRGYNKQYSFENSIIAYYPRQLAEEQITKYANRVIYSEQAIEGEQVDAYRIFLPNNYHDIPKDKGEITELFVHNHKYYIHTSGALYLSSFNDRAAVASSIGDVYLGNGGVFSRPSEPILTLNGGYAGTTSSCGINTPYGRMFTDNLNSKVYLLGEDLKEISELGMFKYFAKEIQDIADTPSQNSGYVSSYDLSNHRLLLTKLGDAGWTLSYSPQLNSWSSYHSYLPYHYITFNQRLFSAVGNQLWEHNTGDYGIYYGDLPSPMQIDIVLNDVPNITKTFDNLTFFTTSQNDQDIEQHYDTFNTLHCYNTTRNTGKCRLIVPRNYQEDFQTLGLFECFAKLKSNEFRVSILNDLVLDVNQSIFVPTNLAISRQYRPTMSGKWMIASLVYNNLRNNRFVVHNIGRIFRQRIR
jgi:hypothetical protein